MHIEGVHARRLVVLIISVALVGLIAPDATGAPGGKGGKAGGKCSSKKHDCGAGDVTAPSIGITSPANGSSVEGVFSVTGWSSDDDAVARVDVSVDGGAWTAAQGTTAWSASVDTSAYASGSHVITARATDRSGLRSSSSVTLWFVSPPPPDTTPPSVWFTSPTAGATVSGTITVTGSASDPSGISLVELRVDDGPWRAANGTTTWSATVETTAYADGSHMLSARARDPAGNISVATRSVAFSNAPAPPPPTGDPFFMVTPEGATISIEGQSRDSWTAQQIYSMLQPNARDLHAIGPTLTIKVQDTYASSASIGVSESGGTYYNFQATIYLKGINSTFSIQPTAILTHEYGHVWTHYHLYMSQGGSWSTYLNTRWASAGGATKLAADPRLNSSYSWSTTEIIADDYRFLFGSEAAIGERPWHINGEIPDPRTQPGLASFFLNTWAG